MTTKRTVKLKKYADIVNEYNAAGVITPGMLLEVTSAGTVQANSVAGMACAKIFALEDELQGRTISTNFAATEPVQCWMCVPGEEVNCILEDGEDVSEGDRLVSAGNGKLKAFTESAGETPIAVAIEDVDMSGSSGADPSGRIAVRIL